MFYHMDYLFEMHTMKRFEDATLVSILQKMRTQGGKKLSDAEWQALLDTELDGERIARDPEAFERETAGWYESCYLWARVTMASYTRATVSARHHKQALLYCQAVDFSPQILNRRQDLEVYDRMLAVPSVATTSRLPGWVMLHLGMRVRLTTQVLPPWAVQDSAGTIMEIDLSAQDRQRLKTALESETDEHMDPEICLKELPLGVYVKLDNCTQEFLPPQVCDQHVLVGFCEECNACRAFPGWVLVEPICRPWTFIDKGFTGATFKVSRTQLPIMPEAACPLYALQGATCDPGLIAHFTMPKREDSDGRWLIIYVLLSCAESAALAQRRPHFEDKGNHGRRPANFGGGEF